MPECAQRRTQLTVNDRGHLRESCSRLQSRDCETHPRSKRYVVVAVQANELVSWPELGWRLTDALVMEEAMESAERCVIARH